ncbi:hypothetical protein QJS10_CPA08g00299 [Acorus calamus]|uniref:VAN3-binding protein n=1 Tax=Acorus calamus TaxID=4465 RepID=A0AAV9EGW8_ACOCL|nr:hypothetical protein QJS10_CPA08g00299 [Acorus calamus]
MDDGGGEVFRQPEEKPIDPMEFLSRSWSVAELAPSPTAEAADVGGGTIPEEDEAAAAAAEVVGGVSGNNFSFASSATSQLVMERIMSQSEVSPLTSGRLSHSSGPLNGGGSHTDSPPVSPSEIDDVKYCRTSNTPRGAQYRGTKTVGRWLKERKERKKEETRAHNAQLHAAVSVAGVAAAVAAVAAATAAASSSSGNDRMARTDMAVASAATLVAAQCVEAAESMGAERDYLASVVGSAVNVKTPGDIVTLTAAAATALRGAATLKARALKEVWNIAAVIPVEKGGGFGNHHGHYSHHHNHHHNHPHLQKHQSDNGSFSGDMVPEDNFLGVCSQELLARGTELLKRTRKGALHWKIVSVYIHRTGQVMLKMKSRHVAGTITKKKKIVVLEVCEGVAAWAGRHLLEGGEQRRYFGLRTVGRGVVEFECRDQREYEMWTQGVSRLLCIVADKKKKLNS